jgi:glucose/arabinose dehydrogenase
LLRFHASVASALALALVVASGAGGRERERPRPPRGFVDELVVAGLRAPTAFAVLPEGRILVAELSGRVRVAVWGRLQARPFLDLAHKVNSVGARGLVDVAVPRTFERRRVVYLYYAFENDPRRRLAPKTMRLTRLRVRGDQAVPGSEVVLVGRRPCGAGRERVDCIPVTCTCHAGGQIGFGRKGAIFLSTGDGSPFTHAHWRSLRAQGPAWLLGKVLRVNGRGLGLRDNPFWTGRARDNRSKVWAYGLRNPWRFTVRPGSGAVVVGDVGWRRWEELDVAGRGANLGWPCYEGPRPQPAFAHFRICKRLSREGAQGPLFAYPHGRAASVTGGVFVPGPRWPQRFRRTYVFGDFVRGVLRYARLGSRTNRPLGPPLPFATGVSGVVDLGVDRNGDLLYLSNSTGELRRIRYR